MDQHDVPAELLDLVKRVFTATRPTLASVAKKCGIARSTVSRYQGLGVLKTSGGNGVRTWISHEQIADAIQRGVLPRPQED